MLSDERIAELEQYVERMRELQSERDKYRMYYESSQEALREVMAEHTANMAEWEQLREQLAECQAEQGEILGRCCELTMAAYDGLEAAECERDELRQQLAECQAQVAVLVQRFSDLLTWPEFADGDEQADREHSVWVLRQMRELINSLPESARRYAEATRAMWTENEQLRAQVAVLSEAISSVNAVCRDCMGPPYLEQALANLPEAAKQHITGASDA